MPRTASVTVIIAVRHLWTPSASVFATFPMGTMLLAGYAKPFIGGAAQIIWFAAVILHAALIVWFTLKYMVGLKLERVFASYFIVYVGIAASSITAPAFGQQAIGQAAFWFAFISLLCLLVPVTMDMSRYRSKSRHSPSSASIRRRRPSASPATSSRWPINRPRWSPVCWPTRRCSMS